MNRLNRTATSPAPTRPLSRRRASALTHGLLISITALGPWGTTDTIGLARLGASPPSLSPDRLADPNFFGKIDEGLHGDSPAEQKAALSTLIRLQPVWSETTQPLLPRVIELSRSDRPEVAHAAMALLGGAAKDRSTRAIHGSELIRAIGAGIRSIDPRLQELAGHAITPALVNEQRQMAIPILVSACRANSANARLWGVIAAGKLNEPDDRVIASLKGALNDEVGTVRREAAYALARYSPSSDVVVPELAVLMLDADREVASAAAHTLSKMGEPAIDALFDRSDSGDARVRLLAVAGLGRDPIARQDGKHAPRIIRLFLSKLDDPDSAVATEAANRLSVYGDIDARVRAVPLLIRAASADSIVGHNARLSLARCLRAFVNSLSDPRQAEAGWQGLEQFPIESLKEFVTAYQARYEQFSGHDLRPVFESAAIGGTQREYRLFAETVLSWVPPLEK